MTETRQANGPSEERSKPGQGGHQKQTTQKTQNTQGAKEAKKAN